MRAAGRLSRGELGGGLTHLRRARRRLRDHDGSTDPVDPAAARLSCAFLEALAARLAGAPDAAEDAARAAEALRDVVPVEPLDRHPELFALLLDHVGSTRLWAGDFKGARSALARAADLAPGAATALPREDALGRLALIDCLNGWLCRAERTAREALAETERFGLARPAGSGVERLVLAAVAVERGGTGAGAGAARHGGRVAPRAAGPRPGGRPRPHGRPAAPGARRARLRVEGGADGCAGRHRVAVGAGETAVVAAAARLAEGRAQAAATLLSEVPRDQVACVVGAAWVQLAAGRPAAAVGLLDRAAPEGRAGPAVTVRAALVRARAADAAGTAPPHADTSSGRWRRRGRSGCGVPSRRPGRGCVPI